jgi:hypothetical protein
MLRGNALHGVVSYPALLRLEVEHPGDYATFNSNQLHAKTFSQFGVGEQRSSPSAL